MVSYAQLNNMSTSKLTSAAEASEGLSGDLSGQAEEVRCASEIPPGLWYGRDADSAISRVARMAPPLDDASDAFKSGQGGLEDLVEGIEAAKEHLEGAHDLAREHSLTIDSDGTVSWGPPPASIPPELHQEYHDGKSSMAQQARGIIDEALEMAVEADEAAVSAFESTAGDAQESYFAAFPGKQEDLDRIFDILNDEDSRYDPETVAELNDLLSEYSDDPMFTTAFIERTNPESLLRVLGDMSMHGANLYDIDDGQAEVYQEFQQNLADTLATATRDGDVSEEWVQGLMDAGAAPMENALGDNHIGYQVLAPLLEQGGEFGEDFLTPVTEHMVRLDQETGGLLGGSDGTAQIENPDNPYVIGEPSREQSNPLNAAMVALDNSPEAATSFFSGSEAYSDMNYSGFNTDSLDATDGNVEYMLDRAANGNSFAGSHINPDFLGNALEAGATGLSSDAPVTAERPEHTEEMVNVAERTINWVGQNPEEVAWPDSPLNDMTDNLGGITANYIEDFHHAFANNEGDADMWQMNSHGEPLNLGDHDPRGQEELRRFLQVIGHDQDASNMVADASEATMFNEVYGASEMDGSDQSDVERATEPHSRIMAEVENGQYAAIANESFTESHGANSNVDFWEEVVSRGGSEVLSEVPGAGRFLSEGWSYATSGIADTQRVDPIEEAIESQNAYEEAREGQFEGRSGAVITEALSDSGMSDDEIAQVVEVASNEYGYGINTLSDFEWWIDQAND